MRGFSRATGHDQLTNGAARRTAKRDLQCSFSVSNSQSAIISYAVALGTVAGHSLGENA